MVIRNFVCKMAIMGGGKLFNDFIYVAYLPASYFAPKYFLRWYVLN